MTSSKVPIKNFQVFDLSTAESKLFLKTKRNVVDVMIFKLTSRRTLSLLESIKKTRFAFENRDLARSHVLRTFFLQIGNDR